MVTQDVLFIGKDAFVQMIDEEDWERYDRELAAFFRAGREVVPTKLQKA